MIANKMASKLSSLSGTMVVFLALVSLTSATSSTYMGIFDIPFTVTMVNESSTSSTQPSQAVMEVIVAKVAKYLYEEYKNTTGFITISAPSLQSYNSSKAVLNYTVVYNKTILNEAGLLTTNNSTFIGELILVATSFTSSSYSIDGFSISGDDTGTAMIDTIQRVNTAFNSTQWICSGLLCSKSSTCYQNETTHVVSCVNKCLIFTADNTVCTAPPTMSGVYVLGTCAYNQYDQPYCNCGMSVGNIMNNLYDGTQCVSATFITAMSAAGGGVILILCIILIIIINNQRETMLRVYDTERKYKLVEAAAHSDPTAAGVMQDKASINVYAYQDPTINTLTSADVYRGEIRLADFQPSRQEVVDVKIAADEVITEQF